MDSITTIFYPDHFHTSKNYYLEKCKKGFIYSPLIGNTQNPGIPANSAPTPLNWSQASGRYRTSDEQKEFLQTGVDKKLPALWTIEDFQICSSFYIRKYILEQKSTPLPIAALELLKHLPKYSLSTIIQNLTKCKACSNALSQIATTAFDHLVDNKPKVDPEILDPDFYQKPYTRNTELWFNQKINDTSPITTPTPATKKEEIAFFKAALHSPLIHWYYKPIFTDWH